MGHALVIAQLMKRFSSTKEMDSLTPPIADPKDVSSAPEAFQSRPRHWKSAPKMVRRALYLVCFTSAVFFVGLSMIAIASVARGKLPDLQFLATTVPVYFFVVAQGFALWRGWKIAWFTQILWSIDKCGNTMLLLWSSFVFDLSEFGFENLDVADFLSIQAVNLVLTLLHVLVICGWFKSETRSWFGVSRRER